MEEEVACIIVVLNHPEARKMETISNKNTETEFKRLIAYCVHKGEQKPFLMRGCSELNGGCSELNGGCSELNGGCSELNGGCSELNGGCSELNGGCSELNGDAEILSSRIDP
jgi:hypothetical protein